MSTEIPSAILVESVHCHTLFWRRTTGMADHYVIGLVLAAPEYPRPELFLSERCIARLRRVEKGFQPLERLDNLIGVLRWELSELPCTDPVAHVADIAGKMAQELKIEPRRRVCWIEPIDLSGHADLIMNRSFPFHKPLGEDRGESRRISARTRLSRWLARNDPARRVNTTLVSVSVNGVTLEHEFFEVRANGSHLLHAPRSRSLADLVTDVLLIEQIAKALSGGHNTPRVHLIIAGSAYPASRRSELEEFRASCQSTVVIMDLDDASDVEILTSLITKAGSNTLSTQRTNSNEVHKTT